MFSLYSAITSRHLGGYFSSHIHKGTESDLPKVQLITYLIHDSHKIHSSIYYCIKKGKKQKKGGKKKIHLIITTYL